MDYELLEQRTTISLIFITMNPHGVLYKDVQ